MTAACVITMPCYIPSQRSQDLFDEAVKSIQSIQTAEAAYHRHHNRHASLLDLGPHGAGLISARAAEREYLKYTFRVEVHDNRYQLTAESQIPEPKICCRLGRSQTFSFYADESGVVQYYKRCHSVPRPIM